MLLGLKEIHVSESRPWCIPRSVNRWYDRTAILSYNTKSYNVPWFIHVFWIQCVYYHIHIMMLTSREPMKHWDARFAFGHIQIAPNVSINLLPIKGRIFGPRQIDKISLNRNVCSNRTRKWPDGKPYPIKLNNGTLYASFCVFVSYQAREVWHLHLDL